MGGSVQHRHLRIKHERFFYRPLVSKDIDTNHMQYIFRRRHRENISCVPAQNIELNSTKNTPRTLKITIFIYCHDVISL